jgi:hypothetical protein
VKVIDGGHGQLLEMPDKVIGKIPNSSSHEGREVRDHYRLELTPDLAELLKRTAFLESGFPQLLYGE